MKHSVLLPIILSAIILLQGCRESVAPKPGGYKHIENTTSEYIDFTSNTFPLKFSVSNGASVESNPQNKNWLNISYPKYNASIYCTYLEVSQNSVDRVKAESRELVYRHAQQAEIKALSYNDTIRGIDAELYQLWGNAATPLQFIISNNSSYIFRGAFYFDNQVNLDSVADVTEYVKEDIMVLIESINPR